VIENHNFELSKITIMFRLFNFIIVVFLLSACKHDTKNDTTSSAEKPIAVVHIIDNPSQTNSERPRLFSNGEELFFSWVEGRDAIDVLYYAKYSEDTWRDVTEVIQGDDWFTNWADFPAVAENNGNILTSFLQKSAPGTYTYDVKLNLYQSELKTSKNNFILHNDGTKSEHGFVSMLPSGEDQFFVTWLDGRNTVGGHGDHDSHGSVGAMTLRAAYVSADGEIVNDEELDNRICDCCQTSAAMTPNGPVVVYRDRSETEVRDISIVRWMGDLGWSEPQTVYQDNWEIAGCPVNGPSIDAIGNNLAVAWFTVAEGSPKVQVAFSVDGGFGFPIRIDAHDAIGRVDIVMLSESEAAVSWMENIGDEAAIQLVKVNNKGEKSKPISIAITSPERASGFPQIELLHGKVYAAWTSVDSDDKKSIVIASVLLEDL
jgi:hypothetical protein